MSVTTAVLLAIGAVLALILIAWVLAFTNSSSLARL